MIKERKRANFVPSLNAKPPLVDSLSPIYQLIIGMSKQAGWEMFILLHYWKQLRSSTVDCPKLGNGPHFTLPWPHFRNVPYVFPAILHILLNYSPRFSAISWEINGYHCPKFRFYWFHFPEDFLRVSSLQNNTSLGLKNLNTLIRQWLWWTTQKNHERTH